ncbi:MAG TPA: hypothetical protein VMT89_11445, partial [Candidatus Acidoferrales bacterium]|nr:hypothetical protein [Candidatus Acidoferrales bacterium]
SLPSLSAVRRDVPTWLGQIIERLTAKQPHARYQSADEALLDLKQRRVQARELPPLPRQVCLECGSETPAELPLCLSCGQEASLRLRAGDVDVRCDKDEDDTRLTSFLQTIVGTVLPRRRRRTLLFTALDGVSADRLVRRAGEHGLMLTATPHSSRVELRKALAMAVLCFVSSWCGLTLGSAQAYYGSALAAWAQEQTAPAWLMWLVAGVLSWLAARRVYGTEVEPLIELKGAALGGVQREVAWLQRLVPSLTSARSDETKAFVAELVEKYDRLVRFARAIDAPTAQSLEQLLVQAAQLASLIGEIETALRAPIFAERAQRYAFVENQLRVEQDPQERSALTTRAAALHDEVAAFCALEEKCAALTGTQVAVHAFFNRLVGRLLVYHAPIDKESRDRLTTYTKALRDDLEVSREVQAEIERCR